MLGRVIAELERIPRFRLATLPTPLHEAPRLARAIGLDRLLLKRDDNTGLAFGGNKARKLEYLVADAIRLGSDILVTLGAPQSNHCRMRRFRIEAEQQGANKGVQIKYHAGFIS